MDSRTEAPESEVELSLVAVPSTYVPVESPSTVLSVLSDDVCRSLLGVADEPLTAKELAAECDMSSSTVYRKLDALARTPLVDATVRPRLHGKHPQQYRRRFDAVRIRVPPGRATDVEVSLVPRPPRE